MSLHDAISRVTGFHRAPSAGMILRDGTLLIPRTEPREITGERRLLIAVLDEALSAYTGHAFACQHDASRAKLQLDAEAWFWSDADDWPFAFVSICEELGLSVQAVRGRLSSLQRRYRRIPRERPRPIAVGEAA